MTALSEAHRQAISKGLQRAIREGRKPGPKPRPVVHGTVDGYVNHKCRCPRCREAWRLYYHERKKRRGG